jgi:hypothetical protein
MEYFIDKRIMVSGKKSQIHLDNPFNLTGYIETLLWQLSVTGAQNGLNIQTVVSSSGIQLNYVELGGSLLHATSIDGDGNSLSISDLSTLVLSTNSMQLLAYNTFNLRTPAVLATTATAGQFLKLNNAVSGSCEWANLPINKYAQDFVIADWVGTDLFIPATTHGRGIYPTITVIDDSSGSYVAPPLGVGNVINTIKIALNGDITIVHGLGAFNGRLIII